MKLPLNLGHFKKIKEDQHSATLQHPQGHEIKIAKKILSPKMMKQLGELPTVGAKKFAEGGDVAGDPMMDQRIAYYQQKNPQSSYGDAMANVAVEDQQRKDSQTAEEAAPQIAHEAALASLPKTAAEEAARQSDVPPPVSAPSAPMPSEEPPEIFAPQGPQPASVPSTQPSQAPSGISVGGLSDPILVGGYQKQAQGIAQAAEAESAAAKAQAGMLEMAAKKQQIAIDAFNMKSAELDKERAAFMQDYKNQHIDPNHYLHSMGTGQKIATGIGMILGGMGSATAGGENPAVKFLHDQIGRDVEAQKANLGKTENLLNANYKQFGNLKDAAIMTQAMQTDLLKDQLQMAAAKSTDPLVKARAIQAIGKLEQEIAPQMLQLKMRQSLQNGAAQGADPAQYVQYVVPKEHQAKVFGEIEAAQNTQQMSKSIMESFERAAKENTIARTGFGLARTPGSVYALHQAMQPTFKDLEGTVRQAAMENTFKNITPAPGDSEYTVKIKREALGEYLKSKMSAPTAKGYGIDLQKFQSTSSDRMMHLNPKEQSYAKWAQANPGNAKAQLVLKKLGF